jgi:hypothetical protein
MYWSDARSGGDGACGCGSCHGERCKQHTQREINFGNGGKGCVKVGWFTTILAAFPLGISGILAKHFWSVLSRPLRVGGQTGSQARTGTRLNGIIRDSLEYKIANYSKNMNDFKYSLICFWSTQAVPTVF